MNKNQAFRYFDLSVLQIDHTYDRIYCFIASASKRWDIFQSPENM